MNVGVEYTPAEKTKLSGIETGATADQTASEIKTAYESNSDTNAFTDADHTKLDGIADGAQVNVGEEYTSTEKTKLSGIEDSATADQTASEIKTAYESNTNTNAFTDANSTRLADAITGVDEGTGIRIDDGSTDTPEINIADSGVDTSQLADGAVTDDKVESVDASKLIGTRGAPFIRSDSSAPIGPLPSGGRPTGIWSDGTTMWVADLTNRSILAYTLSTGARDSTKDFSQGLLQGASNEAPRGMWSDGTTLWVVNSTPRNLYAWTLATRTRDASKDILSTALASGNTTPTGTWSDGTTIWIANSGDSKLYAYNLSTRTYDSSKDIDLDSENANPTGVWGDGATIWVSDYNDDKAYAYDIASRIRDATKDFNNLTSYNIEEPYGMWSDGETIWVASHETSRRRVYPLQYTSSNAFLSISTDDTIDGNGTASSPLSVANPFTDADETKLDELANIKSIGTNLALAPDGTLNASAGGGTSGLTAVSTDSTITGDGTSGDPLSVANPFTDTDETKLDGIEDNATADQSATEIRDALQSLSNDSRLDGSSIKNIGKLETIATGNVQGLAFARLFNINGSGYIANAGSYGFSGVPIYAQDYRTAHNRYFAIDTPSTGHCRADAQSERHQQG